jgi:hypothetical protein
LEKQRNFQRFAHSEALSLGDAKALIVRGWRSGRFRPTPHFRRRALERDFTLIDAENAVLRGVICGPPEFCVRFRNWKYRIETRPEEGKESFGVVVALDMLPGCLEPLIVLITGYRVQ